MPPPPVINSSEFIAQQNAVLAEIFENMKSKKDKKGSSVKIPKYG